MYTVCDAQKECIEELKILMSRFLNKNRSGYTKVIPLSIPTGWGKTRIAIQSILKTVSNKSANVILWPQNENHIKRIWQRTGDWMGDAPKKFFMPCWNPLHKKICSKDFRYYKNGKKIKLDVYNEKSFEKYRNIKFYWTINRNHEFKGDAENLRLNLGNDPIFYIIDEWHSFDLINEFREECEKQKKKPSKALAKKFWRKRLLFGNCKKNNLFVLLLSATPIASANAMDKIFDKADSSNINESYEEDVKAKEAVQSDLKLFDIMTQVGFNSMKHKVHKVFPKVFEKRSYDLEKEKTKEQNKRKYKKLKKDYSSKPKSFADYYISVANEIVKSKIKFPYQREQSVFAKPKSQKVAFIKEFLNQCPPQRHILIFCHYRSTVAQRLAKSLEEFGDRLVYLDENMSDAYINKCIDDFNNPKGKLRYLIVTDMYSQGIDLHKADAWVLHYELAWNPIRIIQRFGRVWRMKHPGAKKNELSHPVAFHMPLTYSSEEEQLSRLKRRWNTLKEIFKKNAKMMAPIDFEIALGIRLTPEPEIIQKK